MSHPYDFGQARQAETDAAHAQKSAEQWLVESTKAYAAAEKAYRLSLAEEITKLHGKGVAWSSTADLARGDKRVADLRYLRDVAEGVKEAAVQAAWRAAADRKATGRFVQWSERAQFRDEPEPDGPVSVIGGRRAA